MGQVKMAKLTKTSTPGIFRRHKQDCDGKGRCECAYVVVWRHRGKQHKETFRTANEAREAQGGRKAGDKRPMSKVRFGDYFGEWIESYTGRTARGFSETTRPEYRRPIEAHAIPKWGAWKLAEVEPADVRELFGAMRKDGATTSQIRKLRVALSALFATAVDDGLLRSNPCQGVRIPAGHSDDPVDDRAKALTREELALLLAAIPEGWQLFFEFLAVTGLRISEAIGLTWEHVDLGDRPHVKVREQFYRGERRRLKSGSGRRDIPLSKAMAARLLAHRRDTYKGPKAPVFASEVGTPLNTNNIRNRVLDPAAKSISLSIGFHAFRHTCASMLFEEGRNVKQVAEWLGHSDPSFTLNTYVHLMDAGVGTGLDLDAQGNTGATGGLQTAANPAETAYRRLVADWRPGGVGS
jgi:integrase